MLLFCFFFVLWVCVSVSLTTYIKRRGVWRTNRQMCVCMVLCVWKIRPPNALVYLCCSRLSDCFFFFSFLVGLFVVSFVSFFVLFSFLQVGIHIFFKDVKHGNCFLVQVFLFCFVQFQFGHVSRWLFVLVSRLNSTFI